MHRYTECNNNINMPFVHKAINPNVLQSFDIKIDCILFHSLKEQLTITNIILVMNFIPPFFFSRSSQRACIAITTDALDHHDALASYSSVYIIFMHDFVTSFFRACIL